MRFLVSLRPFYGHLHPMAPTARALEKAGHEVIVSSAESFRAAVEAEGFHFQPAGRDPRTPVPDAEPGGNARDWGEVATRQKLENILALAATFPPDVIVRDQTDFAPLLAAESLGVPCATLGPAMLVPPRSWADLQGSSLDRIRADYDLAPDPEFARIHPYLYLDVTPPVWQPEAEPLDVRHYVRPIVLPSPPNPWSPPETDGRPLAYVTLGTVYNQRPNLLRALIEGALASGHAVVATVGAQQDPNTLGLAQIDGAHVCRWLPQLEVLPHCRLALSHGGFSTLMGALAHGIPLVVVPLGSDNHAHARRSCELGAALPLSVGEVDAESVREAASRLSREPQWRRGARRLRDQIQALPDPEHAAELLVRLAREREPVRAAPCRVRRQPRRRLQTAVVVPVNGSVDRTHAVLQDISYERVAPVIVDNRGDYQQLSGERILRPGRDLGWGGGCNHALRELAGEGFAAFVLLNNNTRLSPDFFAGLWEARKETGAWIVGPMYDGSSPYQVADYAGVPACYRPQPVHRSVPFLDSDCLFLPAETVAAVGLFETESFPRGGWGLSLDYALRTRRVGGNICATELAYLHRGGSPTSGEQETDSPPPTWAENVAGGRKWGQAWPIRVRARARAGGPSARSEPSPAPGVSNTAVFVLGPACSGGTIVARALDLLGVAPPPHEVRTRLQRLNADLVGQEPWARDRLVRVAHGVADEALAAARALAGYVPRRPWVWRDPHNDFLLPFWAAVLDVRVVSVLVLRDPLELAQSSCARFGRPAREGLASWESALRHALANLAGRRVLVTTLDELRDDTLQWARRIETFLTEAGVSVLVPANARALHEVVRPELDHRDLADVELSEDQRNLYDRALTLIGVHDRFPSIDVSTGSRRHGEDLAIRTGSPNGNGSGAHVPGATSGRPRQRRTPPPVARAMLDDPIALPWEEIAGVLVLSSGDDQPGSLFASLGKRVTTVHLSPERLHDDLERARASVERGTFDLVYQLPSTCFVDDIAPLHRAAAAALRTGGWYWAEHVNPVLLQLEGFGRWAGTGYRIIRSQAGNPAVLSEVEEQDAPLIRRRFVHGLGDLIGTLGEVGFVTVAFAERHVGHAGAPAGSADHLAAHVPPSFAVLARLVGSESGLGSPVVTSAHNKQDDGGRSGEERHDSPS
jgi:MGT family glycosyltransferase